MKDKYIFASYYCSNITLKSRRSKIEKKNNFFMKTYLCYCFKLLDYHYAFVQGHIALYKSPRDILYKV